MPQGKLRRTDRSLDAGAVEALLKKGLFGCLATVGSDGMPYITPLNHVYEPESASIYFHHSSEPGHLLENLNHSPRGCFAVNEPGRVFATGEYACNTGQSYQSVICFGRVSQIADANEKKRVLGLFAKKYIDQLTPDRKYRRGWQEIGSTAILAMKIEEMTGKHCKAPQPG